MIYVEQIANKKIEAIQMDRLVIVSSQTYKKTNGETSPSWSRWRRDLDGGRADAEGRPWVRKKFRAWRVRWGIAIVGEEGKGITRWLVWRSTDGGRPWGRVRRQDVVTMRRWRMGRIGVLPMVVSNPVWLAISREGEEWQGSPNQNEEAMRGVAPTSPD